MWQVAVKAALIGLIPDVVKTLWDKAKDKWFTKKPPSIPPTAGAAVMLMLLLTGCTAALQCELANQLCPPKPCPEVPAPCPPCPGCPPCPPIPPEPPQPPGEEYIIKPDERVERRVSVPGWVEFDIAGKLPSVEDGGPRDNTHLCWAYLPGQEWGGGNAAGAIGYRDYATKAYHADGPFAGQTRYTANWQPDKTYRVRCAIDAGAVAIVIDGVRQGEVEVRTASQYTLGIGWPPEKRPGAEGARLKNIKWSN